jgi:hypothetical protein
MKAAGSVLAVVVCGDPRPAPKRHSFSPLAAAGAPDLCPTRPIRPSTRDGRQAMPCAEPALPQVAPLPLPAVVGAATLRGRQSPPPPSGYPWESPEADLVLLHAPCHDTLRTHGPKGRSGGAAGDCRPDHNLGVDIRLSTITFG